MTVGSISASGLSQYVLSASNSTQLQQSLQTLQNTLSSGDLTGAQSARFTKTRLQPVEAVRRAVLNSLPIWQRSAAP
jgi:hypothetical protein